MTEGKVAFFNNAKGWGLIEGDSGGVFFIHHSDIVDDKFSPENKPERFRTLNPGELVSFNTFLSGKKFTAAKQLTIVGNIDE